MVPLTREEVVAGTAREVTWWLAERLKKFRELSHGTMSVNPFMAPVVMALHSHMKFSDLAELLLAGHFMAGHATGFGKLIDEKLLPGLFGSTKLTAAFRRTAPFCEPVFSEVDHIIGFGTPAPVYLSLKASRWTIQLTMGERMNQAFAELIEKRAAKEVQFEKIVVGAIYGTQEALRISSRSSAGYVRGHGTT